MASSINWTAVEAVGTWVAAVPTAFALVLAVLGLRKAGAAERRAQAALVAAWSTVEPPLNEEMPNAPEGSEEWMEWFDGMRMMLHVANRSDRPVTDILVTTSPRLGEDGPGGTRVVSLGPGEIVSVPNGTTSRHDALGYPGRVLTTRLTDSAGITWLRDHATLREVKHG